MLFRSAGVFFLQRTQTAHDNREISLIKIINPTAILGADIISLTIFYPDSSQFTEVWNLVFTQFNRTENGEYLPLSSPNIDTGMGLERLAMISQDADNIFEIDFMKKLMGEVEKLSHKKYKTLEKDDISMRIIGNHTKATL